MNFEKKYNSQNPPQFDLRWLFGSIALLCVCFAAVATNGNAVGVVIILGMLAPAFALAWIAWMHLRDRTFGVKSEPLASTRRDPLGFNETAPQEHSREPVEKSSEH